MKLGFLVSTLDIPCLIENINRVLPTRPDLDICVFYENAVKPPIPPKFATMNITDAWNYSGDIVATDLSTATKILRFPNIKRKYFYVYSLEWTEMVYKEYEQLASIYQNPKLNLLAQNTQDAQIIEQVWNRPVFGVVDTFEIKSFLNFLESEVHGLTTQ